MSRIESDRKTLRFILKNIDACREASSAAYKIREALVDLTLNNTINERQFYKITSILTPQSRSPLWERYFITKNGCKKVNLRDSRGDFEKDGIFYEYKASGYNQDCAINIVQIRLWQKCNYVIQSISDDSIETFLLSHEEMEAETVLLNASSAHGTKQVLKRNKRNELRMTLFPGSEDWSRWVEQYKNRAFFKE